MEMLALASSVLAAVCGFNTWMFLDEMLRSRRYRGVVRSLEAPKGKNTVLARSSTPARGNDAIIDYMVRASRRLALGKGPSGIPDRLLNAPWYEANKHVSGLNTQVSEDGYAYARLHYAALGAACCFLLGFMVSTPLGMLGFVGGAALGFSLPRRVVKKRIQARAEELEQRLSEMLDVIAMGLHSGLSFDRSLELYIGHFDSLLAESMALAQTQWTHGLSTRNDALRTVAASYDSALFSRVVDNIIRSLRFGSSLATVLEETARESRIDYQAKRQEAVAKAPVKMMLPTGALILPAMLLLVLGPVMLELMGGF